jgi:hypothetical protein
MTSSQGDRIPSKPTDSVYELVLSQVRSDLAEQINIEQMFMLIDGVLPFEACLYYQVLPLLVEGTDLYLGMVSSEDGVASDYVRRIISYHHYSLVPQPITSELHQAVLSAYLNYSGQQQAIAQRQPAPPSHRSSRPASRARSDQAINPDIQRTLVVDSPEELGTEIFSFPTIPQAPTTPPPQIPFTPTPLVAPLTTLQEDEDDPAILETTPPPVEEDLIPPAVPITLLERLPELVIQTNYLSSPIEAIASLPAHDLLQELLGRVLYGGIGRLYFEPQSGRILWSQNGILQSVLEQLQPEIFQGLINELKQMAGLTPKPIQATQQVEIERLYQQSRILLRIKFIPTEQGIEEATLQVLRGAALKFYQQQQLASLERDALTIAKQLQTKISEIRDRAYLESSLTGTKLDILPALSQLIRGIEAQLNTLQTEEDLPE